MPNSYWVVPGEFAAGEYPGDLSSAKAEEKVRALLQAGVTHFIDLTTKADHLDPYADVLAEEARRQGVQVAHLRHPVTDMSIPDHPQDMIDILDAIDDARAAGKTAYVHCWGGVGRTGTVVGCWLVRHGHTGEEALARIAEWWKGMEPDKRARHYGSPERGEQCDYVRDWREREREPSRA